MNRGSESEEGVLTEVTLLLKEWGQGDSAAFEKLLPAVYQRLRMMAGRYFSFENEGQTLCATALVSEVYLRMADGEKIAFKDRKHFFAMAGRMMRRILVEQARKRLTAKRGGNLKVTLNEETDTNLMGSIDLPTLMTLERAMEVFEKENPRAVRILEWRVFAGLGNQEVASLLDVSLATVKREWTQAKQRLFLIMNRNNRG